MDEQQARQCMAQQRSGVLSSRRPSSLAAMIGRLPQLFVFTATVVLVGSIWLVPDSFGGIRQARPTCASSNLSTGRTRVLVTGGAGFIGMHVCLRLHQDGHTVISYDNVNPYYSQLLKRRRIEILNKSGIVFVEADVCDEIMLRKTMIQHGVHRVVHLAAQAGVRYSLHHPFEYIHNNINCFVTLLETIVNLKSVSQHPFIYASSSSVYGLNTRTPFTEHDSVESPASLYAATKRSDELLAFVYHNLYGLSSVGLRFFTVYGPWGRPDMSPFIFTNGVSKGTEIQLFNDGKSRRDFTYVDDVVDGIVSALAYRTVFPEVINLGNNRPVSVLQFLGILEVLLGRKAVIKYTDMQDGDVPITYASISKASCLLGYQPKVSIEDGLHRFVKWYVKEGGAQYIGTTHVHEVCFVTSLYSPGATFADHPPDVSHLLRDNPTFKFILFTNMQEISAPGWERVVKPVECRRFITQSRWAKFLAWKHPGMQLCQGVVYMDAWIKPSDNASEWRDIVTKIRNSKSGLMQYRHSRQGPLDELSAILAAKKDIKRNVDASASWLTHQNDFDERSPVYINTFFGYDPSNPRYQLVSQAFWDRYSLELDSWRDQPVWSYMLHKYRIKPVPFPSNATTLFVLNSTLIGFAQHVYNASQDRNH